jgi:repressor LexA
LDRRPGFDGRPKSREQWESLAFRYFGGNFFLVRQNSATILPMHAQTRRQREVLDFITRHIETHGYRPSYAVIARHLGVRARSGIARIVKDLETQGLLTRRREDGHFYVEMGGVKGSAGGVYVEWLEAPIDYRERYEEFAISLPEFLLGPQSPERIRVFRVSEDTLAGDGIHEDDIVLIELRQFVRDGNIVAAVIEGKTTVLRKYFRHGAHVELRPSDGDEMGTIRVLADHVEIKGIFRGLLRPIS